MIVYEWCSFYKDRMYLHDSSPLLQVIFHENHTSTHEGFFKTSKRIRAMFYWRRMLKKIKEFVRTCEICQRHKSMNVAPSGLLQPLPISTETWKDLSMDFMTGLPTSHGKILIFVVVCRLSKYYFLPPKHPYIAVSVAQLLFAFKLHGLPYSIISYGLAPHFQSKGGPKHDVKIRIVMHWITIVQTS